MISLLVPILMLVHSAQADHRARFETKSNRTRIPDMSGEILLRDNGDARINADRPAAINVLLIRADQKALILIPMLKMVADSDVKKYESQVPACVGKAIESCLTQSGFKKKKTDKSPKGENESVYEKSNKTGTAKLWVPENSSLPFPSKMVFESKDGMIVTTRFTDPKELPLDAKLFTVPSDYKKSKGLGNVFGQ